MKKYRHFIFVFLSLSFLLGAKADERKKIRAQATRVRWPQLLGMNPRTGAMSEKLKAKLAKPIKIRGYPMPLEASGKGVRSIFLVSDPMFCGHVPPPPPNQLIYVDFKEPLPWRIFERSLWLTGVLKVRQEKAGQGTYGYELENLAGLEKGGW